MWSKEKEEFLACNRQASWLPLVYGKGGGKKSTPQRVRPISETQSESLTRVGFGWVLATLEPPNPEGEIVQVWTSGSQELPIQVDVGREKKEDYSRAGRESIPSPENNRYGKSTVWELRRAGVGVRCKEDRKAGRTTEGPFRPVIELGIVFGQFI